MGSNDILQLDTHFQSWMQTRASGLKRQVEPFFYYVVENVLKPLNWPDEDIAYGLTDKGNDGGVDAFYFVVNKNTLVRDNLDTTADVQNVKLIVIQVKSSANDTGFKPLDLVKFQKFTEDLLDLGRPAESFNHKYQPHLITLMRTFKEKFLKISVHSPSIHIDYYLVTRGDEEKITPSVSDEIAELKNIAQRNLTTTVNVEPVDTQKLLAFVRAKRPTQRQLKWRQQPLQVDDRHIGLVRLKDYVDFLKDRGDGSLDETIFDSNVRGYQMDTPVNKQIRGALAKIDGPDFWLLNNGVTIVSDGQVRIISALLLQIENAQIVNGLQTSREIFNHYKLPANLLVSPEDERAVLVRVIPVKEPKSRDDIIVATNSQNRMSPASLRATDEIHRAIEAEFQKSNLFYDRRRGFYKDQGKPIAQIVSVLDLVQALLAILVGRPDAARGRPGDFLKKNTEYASLFGKDRVLLGAYLKCVNIMRRVESFYEDKGTDRADLQNIEFYVAYLLVRELIKSSYVNSESLMALKAEEIDFNEIEAAHTAVWNHYINSSPAGESHDAFAKGPRLLAILKAEIEAKYGPPPAEIKTPHKKKKVREVLSQNHGAER